MTNKTEYKWTRCSICKNETWCRPYNGKVKESLYSFYICDNCLKGYYYPNTITFEVNYD